MKFRDDHINNFLFGMFLTLISIGALWYSFGQQAASAALTGAIIAKIWATVEHTCST